jgi:hypothetical protein
MSLYLAVDPGLQHTAFVLLEIRREGPSREIHVYNLWSMVASMKGELNPDKERARTVCQAALHGLQTVLDQSGKQLNTILVEFQPPLNTRTNPALVRWNCWIEGYIVAFFQAALPMIPVLYAHSSAVKRFFDIASGQYSVNKSLSLAKANSFLGTHPVKTDHEADCVLMGVYEFQRHQ